MSAIFLLANPSQTSKLQQVFRINHVRIPVIDYSNAVKDSTFLQRFQDWRRKYQWATRAVRAITIDSLLMKAKKCEKTLQLQLCELLKEEDSASTYTERRITPKLRYLSGRLLYLLSEEKLGKLHKQLEARQELYLIAKTMEAVSSRNFTDVLSMGVNATHAAAQLVRVGSQNSVLISDDIELTPVVEQSLAVLEINGVKHNYATVDTELIMLASAKNVKELMRSENGFVREFACLHGLYEPRHQAFLDSSFDRDEDL